MAEEPKKDRHKKSPLQLRLHELLKQQLAALARRNMSTVTAEITIAVRKHLKDEGLWPPAGGNGEEGQA